MILTALRSRIAKLGINRSMIVAMSFGKTLVKNDLFSISIVEYF